MNEKKDTNAVSFSQTYQFQYLHWIRVVLKMKEVKPNGPHKNSTGVSSIERFTFSYDLPNIFQCYFLCLCTNYFLLSSSHLDSCKSFITFKMQHTWYEMHPMENKPTTVKCICEQCSYNGRTTWIKEN